MCLPTDVIPEKTEKWKWKSLSHVRLLDSSPPGPSVHGIFQARILEWVAVPFSKRSSQWGSNPGLPHYRQILYHLSLQGSPPEKKMILKQFSERGNIMWTFLGMYFIWRLYKNVYFIYLEYIHTYIYQFSSVQLLSRVQLCVTPRISARQASLSITNSKRLLKLMSIKSVMPSSHLILCRPLLLFPPLPPSIRVFSKESTLLMW